MINSLANMALVQAQEQQQRQNYNRQMASGDFGVDHLGQKVNQDQRSAWNDRLSAFRQKNGPATSQQYFQYAENGTPPSRDGVVNAYNQGPMDYGIDGAGIRGSGLGGYGARGVDAFRSMFGRGRQDQGGYNMPSRQDSPYGIGYDISDGWKASMDRGPLSGETSAGHRSQGPDEGNWGMADDLGNDTGGRGVY
jgi:hypothetical protein